MKIRTHSPIETQEIARKIAIVSYNGLTLLLSGDLGAGKTTFTQGLALGLHIHNAVTSPTFTIMKNYHGDLSLNHIDAYRLEGLHQDLGFEELIGHDGVSVIEWPDFIQDLWPHNYIKIDFKYIDEGTRELVLSAQGDKELSIISRLL